MLVKTPQTGALNGIYTEALPLPLVKIDSSINAINGVLCGQKQE
jgi:hypothetical protein